MTTAIRDTVANESTDELRDRVENAPDVFVSFQQQAWWDARRAELARREHEEE